ncbi:MAG: diaminopropionate ammonia-lyase, partial [Fusobacterium sp. JB021]|nr:diaminopropionate ammonia-lyase [Fusobacterium sp. JB021]
VDLESLPKYYVVKKLWIKDESKRFGINAFKVLGGSYAMGKYLSERLNRPMAELPFNVLVSEEIKNQLGEITFVTATDGNHGRGIAWMANKLKQRSIVYMPKGSAIMRLENIRKEGAEATITELNYDDAVRLANDKALSTGGVMVQDTAWDGYEEIPLWIMQGYTTIINEIIEQLDGDKPTHVFLQAGVGSFAGAIQGYLAHLYGEDRPITVICEPHGANCIYKSMEANDGNPHNVTGDLKTIMAGLACGEPNTISWKILRDNSDFSVSCEDSISARGMRVLSSPLGNDKRVISGESGSVGLGLFTVLSDNKEEYKEFLNELKLDENSKVLCISTEGDTDLEGYKNVVWNGMCSNK